MRKVPHLSRRSSGIGGGNGHRQPQRPDRPVEAAAEAMAEAWAQGAVVAGVGALATFMALGVRHAFPCGVADYAVAVARWGMVVGLSTKLINLGSNL